MEFQWQHESLLELLHQKDGFYVNGEKNKDKSHKSYGTLIRAAMIYTNGRGPKEYLSTNEKVRIDKPEIGEYIIHARNNKLKSLVWDPVSYDHVMVMTTFSVFVSGSFK